MAEFLCPIWVTRRVGEKQRQVREQCGKLAVEYEVKGESYSVRQVLCASHAEKARRENFVLAEVKQGGGLSPSLAA